MKKISDLLNAFQAFKETNHLFAKYKFCNHKISNLKNYISQYCGGNANYKLVLMNSLDETQAAIPDYMLITDFFSVNLKLYDGVRKEVSLSACYNLDKNLTIRKPSITIETLTQARSPSLTGQFHDTLFIGKRNAFLGIILYNGVILLFRETLLKLLDYEKEFFEIMNLIMNRVELINSQVFGNSMSGIDTFLKQLSISNMFEENKESIVSVLSHEHENLDCEAVKKLFSGFEDRIYKNYITPILNSTIFGATNIYSYASLLKEMRRSYELKIQQATQEGYNAGLARSSVFLNKGYSPKLVDGGVYWSKKIQIFPEVAIIRNASFKIPDRDRYGTPRNAVYYITELTIHPDGHVSALGRHPNVSSGGTVCLGDLVEKSRRFREMSNEDLTDYVDRVETLLENVNFDSAYFQYDKNFDSSQFTERAAGTSRYAMHHKTNDRVIRDAVFSVDDGVDEEEEEASSSSEQDENDNSFELTEARFESAEIEVPQNA